jgi:hypothetical protein
MIFVVAVSVVSRRYLPAAPAEASISAPANISNLVFTRHFLAGILALSCGVWTQQTFNSLTPGYLAVLPPMGLGVGALVAGKLMNTVLGAGVIASVVGGVLVDKVFSGQVRPVVLTGFVLFAICPILLMIPQICNQRFALILCLMLTGTATPFINPVLLAFAAKTFPPSVVGRVIGSWMGVALFSGAAGVMMGSAELSSTGTYRSSMQIISAIAVLGFFTALFVYPAKEEIKECSTCTSEV